MSSNDYPLPAFHFKVVFSGTGGTWEDTAFKDVSEFGAKVETETISEGGESGEKYIVPKGVKYKNLVLKRGIAGSDSELVQWCKSVIEGNFNTPISLMQISLQLLDEAHEPVRVWTFYDAYPVSWDIEAFSAMENKVAIEKIEFCYHSMKREQ